MNYLKKYYKYKTKYELARMSGGTKSSDLELYELVSNKNKFLNILRTNSNKWNAKVKDGDRDDNRIEQIYSDFSNIDNIVSNYLSVKVICNNDMLNLYCNHINEINKTNSRLKKIYTEITQPYLLINRFLLKRPIVFCDKEDNTYVYKDDSGAVPTIIFPEGGNTFSGYSEYMLNNTITDNAVYDSYNNMIYDELKLSALLVVSCKSKIINACNYMNDRIKSSDDHIEEALIIGGVGARFEKQLVMEFDDMVIETDDKNTNLGQKKQELKEKFMNKYLYKPNDEDIYSIYTKDGKNYHLNNNSYCKRIKILANLSLFECNRRAQEDGKQAYMVVQGLGLGVWDLEHNNNKYKFTSGKKLKNLYVETWVKCIEEGNFPNIQIVYFNYINVTLSDGAYVHKINNITVVTDEKELSGRSCFRNSDIDTIIGLSKIQIENKDNLLYSLVFAWDSNSCAGNEYWKGGESLHGSMDPVIACCSQIPEIMNEHINPFYKVIGKYTDTCINMDDPTNTINTEGKPCLDAFKE